MYLCSAYGIASGNVIAKLWVVEGGEKAEPQASTSEQDAWRREVKISSCSAMWRAVESILRYIDEMDKEKDSRPEYMALEAVGMPKTWPRLSDELFSNFRRSRLRLSLAE